MADRLSPLDAAFLSFTTRGNMIQFKRYARATSSLFALAALEGDVQRMKQMESLFDKPFDLDVNLCLTNAIRSGNGEMIKYLFQKLRTNPIEDDQIRTWAHSSAPVSILLTHLNEWSEYSICFQQNVHEMVTSFIAAGRIAEFASLDSYFTFSTAARLKLSNIQLRAHRSACFKLCRLDVLNAAALQFKCLELSKSTVIYLTTLALDTLTEDDALAFLHWADDTFTLEATPSAVLSALKACYSNVLDFLRARLHQLPSGLNWIFGAFLTPAHTLIFDELAKTYPNIHRSSSYSSIGSMAALDYLIQRGCTYEEIAGKYYFFNDTDPRDVRITLAYYLPIEQRIDQAIKFDCPELYRTCIDGERYLPAEHLGLIVIGRAFKIFKSFYPSMEFFRPSPQLVDYVLRMYLERRHFSDLLHWFVRHGHIPSASMVQTIRKHEWSKLDRKAIDTLLPV